MCEVSQARRTNRPAVATILAIAVVVPAIALDGPWYVSAIDF